MAGSQILERFFEKRHRKWEKRVYGVFQSIGKNYGISSNRAGSDVSPPASLKTKRIENKKSLGF
jgi:hypothetical protein